MLSFCSKTLLLFKTEQEWYFGQMVFLLSPSSPLLPFWKKIPKELSQFPGFWHTSVLSPVKSWKWATMWIWDDSVGLYGIWVVHSLKLMFYKAYLSLTVSCSSVPLQWNYKMPAWIEKKKNKVNVGITFLCIFFVKMIML